MSYAVHALGLAGLLLLVDLDETLILALGVGIAEIQIRAIKDGTAVASSIEQIPIGKILQDGVIYE